MKQTSRRETQVPTRNPTTLLALVAFGLFGSSVFALNITANISTTVPPSNNGPNTLASVENSTRVTTTTTTTTTTTSIPLSNSKVLSLDDKFKVSKQTTDSGDSQNKSKWIGHLNCEYGSVNKYYVSFVVQSRYEQTVHFKATLVSKCLNQITWGEREEELQFADKLNGQKYLFYIDDFESNAEEGEQRRAKRGIFRYFKHLWSDVKNLLTEEEEGASLPRDEMDDVMLKSMENEMNSATVAEKCPLTDGGGSGPPLLFWPDQKHFFGEAPKCTEEDCSGNPFTKLTLPFWLIQLDDGSIPRIRFSKTDTNLEVKNLKKLLATLLATQVNGSNWTPVETSVLGVHHTHYSLSPASSSHISANQIVLNKHINSRDFITSHEQQQQQTETEMELDKQFPVDLQWNQSQIIDDRLNEIVSSSGDGRIELGVGELAQYTVSRIHHSLRSDPNVNIRQVQMLNVLSERHTEASDETLVAQTNKKETILREKYNRLMSQVRAKFGHNEFRYYTNLFDCATGSAENLEYQTVAELISLEQQLNHTNHQHNSIIGDIRRIGTVHNIQLVCGANMANYSSDRCQVFVDLLLRSSSKTAQRDLLYAFQNRENSTERALAAIRMLAVTSKPSRWLIENLAHETHHQTGNSEIKTALLQTLTILAQNEQLIKLRELLCTHIVRRINEVVRNETTTGSGVEEAQLYIVDLVKMLGNLNNYTALKSVQEDLSQHWPATHYITIATIHAFRRSINRSRVQSQLGDYFVNHSSCQLQQEIVQLLIDSVDHMLWEATPDRRWPKYGFNSLDMILANALSNSSNNCVHHHIVEYFKRKVNAKSALLVAKYEHKQRQQQHHYNSTSFDYCVNQVAHFKCDYVQSIGTEMASVQVRKSILVPTSATLGIYSKYSFGVSTLRHRLVVGHLNVIELPTSGNQTYLHVDFDSYKGQTLCVGKFLISANDHHTGRMGQLKLTIPDVVMWSERSWHSEHSLVIQVNVHLAVQLATHDGQSDCEMPKQPTLRLDARIETRAQIVTSSLLHRSGITLNSDFQYRSEQPIVSQQPANSSSHSSSSSSSSLKCLGSEHFEHEIQLGQHFQKSFDPKCNIWREDGGQQQPLLYHWNSTLHQCNSYTTMSIDRRQQQQKPKSETMRDKTNPAQMNTETAPLVTAH